MALIPCKSCGEVPAFKSLDGRDVLKGGMVEYSCSMGQPTCVALMGKNLFVLSDTWNHINQRKNIGVLVHEDHGS